MGLSNGKAVELGSLYSEWNTTDVTSLLASHFHAIAVTFSTHYKRYLCKIYVTTGAEICELFPFNICDAMWIASDRK